MNKATRQKMFNKVARHLLRQGRRSVTGDGCAYRGHGGTRCAIGCLITNKAYSANLEGHSAYGRVVQAALRESGWPVRKSDEELLFSLQRVHDKETPRQWANSLRSLAEQYGLDPSAALGGRRM